MPTPSHSLVKSACRAAVPGTPECVALDRVQAMMMQYPQVDCPVVHRFTPGLYIREIHVPAGTVTITKIHLTEHPYVITKGKVSIWTDSGGIERHEAPYLGVTKAGTRRMIKHHTDTVLTTFHPTIETDVDKIEEQIILPHEPDPELIEEARATLLSTNRQPNLLS